MANLSQEEKFKKAEEPAGKKAEKENKVMEIPAAGEGAAMEAGNKEESETQKEFVIKVKNNPQYCGIGAGGIQFANGQAVTSSRRMASWFREHDGYEVSEK